MNKNNQNFESIESVFDVKFRDKKLIREALTHSSSRGDENYERMEFLGDRVLGLCIADLLYQRFPGEAEGDLAKRHASLVSGNVLGEIGLEIGLDDIVILSQAERRAGGAENKGILADCVESCLGALYLDQGYEICRKVIARLYGERLDIYTRPPQDPKTRLQEWAQGQGYALPEYRIIEQSGPDHAPEFTVELSLQAHEKVTGRGATRREAEKRAATLFLENLTSHDR